MTLEQRILTLLDARAPASSICPSEVARAHADDWRPLMPAVRDAAATLVKQGLVTVTQGPAEVDPLTTKGPLRLRRGPRFSTAARW